MNGSRKPFSPNSEVNSGVPLFSVFQSSASLPLEAARLIFAAHALAGEERPHVGLVLLFGGRHRLNGDGEGLRFGGGTVLGSGFERHSGGIASGGRALNSDRSRFVVHAFA